MITFLNFAPLSFGGGKVTLVDVTPRLANIYGRLVIKRNYDTRLTMKLNRARQEHSSITFSAFIPFTRAWRKMRGLLLSSRLIYIRDEQVHIVKSQKSTRTQRHRLSFFYENISSGQRAAYSQLYRHKKTKLASTRQDKTKLHVAFVGELNWRKGFDTVIEIIKQSPPGYVFHIAGNGPLRRELATGIFLRRPLGDCTTTAICCYCPHGPKVFRSPVWRLWLSDYLS